MIDFSVYKSITIPEGKVKSISVNGIVIWGAETPVEPPVEVVLTGISATYFGGTVPAGTNVSALTGITVTATYSDGTTSVVTGYTLSGTITEGSNTITVSYKGKIATFTVIGEVVVEEGLPSAYQEVTFLRAENNTATYIDLGFAFDTKCRILMNYHIVNNGVTSYPFGAAENSGKLRCMISSPYSSKTYLYGSDGSANKSVNIPNTQGVDIQWEIVLEPSKMAITNIGTGETASATTQGTYTMTTNLLLFAQNYNGTVRYGGIRRIGKFQYYDKNGNLVCDLVPCYRKSDNVCGMYDLVRKTFLTNVGTGADFTKGSNTT